MTDKIYYTRNSQPLKKFELVRWSEGLNTLISSSGTQIRISDNELSLEFTKTTESKTMPKIYHAQCKSTPYDRAQDPLPNPPNPEPYKKTAAGIMQQAIDTMDQRGKTYDTTDKSAVQSSEHPAPVERSMGKVVKMFNTLTDHTLTEEEGWNFMVLLKLGRASHGYNHDNFIDAAAYASLAGEAAANARKK